MEQFGVEPGAETKGDEFVEISQVLNVCEYQQYTRHGVQGRQGGEGELRHVGVGTLVVARPLVGIRRWCGCLTVQKELPVHENQVPLCDCIDNICAANNTH